jgi:Flp pilus assembly protein TadB
MTTILIVIAALVVLAVLLSYAGRMRTERNRRRAETAVQVEEHRGSANARRRKASKLAAKASELSAEANKLDQKAAQEVESAQTEEDRAVEAGRRLKRQRRRRFPLQLTRR